MALLLATIACGSAAHGEHRDFVIAAPLLDQWVYPFSFAPGAATGASIFAAWSEGEYVPQWDNRDGQMLVAFDTSAIVPTGLPATSYTIESMRLSLVVGLDGAFEYDPTQDPLSSWILDREGKPGIDPDPGRPVELFAVDFRGGFTALTYEETTPYGPISLGKGVRYAFPAMFIDGAPVDVSNNVDGLFEVLPAAVGTVEGLAPGDPVPLYSTMRFELDLAQPDLHAWLAAGLGDGRVSLAVASLFHVEIGGSTGFPRFLTKEAPEVALGLVAAPTLEAVVRIEALPADLDGDGVVDGADLGLLLAAWGDCRRPRGCPADLNGDGAVDGADLGLLLAAWS